MYTYIYIYICMHYVDAVQPLLQLRAPERSSSEIRHARDSKQRATNSARIQFPVAKLLRRQARGSGL